MELIPRWTKPVKLTQRALDPLGLSRISDFITAQLLPGITSMTSIARNYSFYCWAIKIANQYNIRPSRRFIAQLESSYIISSLLNKDKNEIFQNDRNPIGNNRARKRIETRPDTSIIDVEFSVLKNSGGGYSQYYTNPMMLLGLTNYENRKLVLTEEGNLLANSFEDNIKETKFYQKFIREKYIPIDVLEELGVKSCYLCLKQKNMRIERDLLCDIFFSKNQSASFIPFSRYYSFKLILSLYDLFSNQGFSLSSIDFRNIVYYGKTKKENKLITPKLVLKQFEQIIPAWKMFQFHEYLTLALESILECFVKSLKKNKSVLTEEQFINENKDFIKYFKQYLSQNGSNEINMEIGFEIKNFTLIEVINVILNIAKVNETYGNEASRLFDQKINIFLRQVKFLEVDIANEIQLMKTKKGDNFTNILSYSILLLLILFIRFKHYKESFKHSDNSNWIYLKFRSENLSLIRIFNQIEPKLNLISLTDFFMIIFKKIVKQHNNIAFRKFFANGNDTYRFKKLESTQEKYVYKKDYEYFERSDKFNVIRLIFEDLGLIKKFVENEHSKYLISDYGKNIITERKE